MMKNALLLLCTSLLLLPAAIVVVQAEIHEFEVLLPPTEAFIHYTNGYIRGPGWIDLTDLTFEAIAESFAGYDNNNAPAPAPAPAPPSDGDGSTNEDGTINVNDDTPPRERELLLLLTDDEDEGHNNNIPVPVVGRRHLDGGYETDAYIVDIAIFHLPDSCVNKKNGCDWTDIGIGGKMPGEEEEGGGGDDNAGGDSSSTSSSTRWCCSQDAMDAGICEASALGTLIRQESFAGNHRYIEVPKSGPMKKKMKFGRFEEEESGQYVVVFANCNVNGREVMVKGESVWRSRHGYLPGELFGFMYFYAALTCIYLLLMAWFAVSMKLNVDSRIPIEKWILMTIILGLIEMFSRTADYARWNEHGYRPYFLVYMGILAGVLKRGISRCLIVMVSLGWGVVRDSLGAAMRAIIILGAAYIGVSAARDLMLVFAVEDLEKLSYDEEVELFDVVTILTFIVAAIDVIYIMWILDALNGTMQYLENMSQTRKLARYLTLRSIFLFSILFATIWVVFSLVDTYDEDGIVREEHEWIVDAATEVNYLFVLIGVAWLWRPNPSAKEYAYVMELPALGGDGDGETELELSGIVPSAMDDDDDENGDGNKRGTNGYHDEDHDKFQIDDAEAA